MSSNDKDQEKLLDHDYDGIRELDNPLPRWWLLTFYLTIGFSVVYYAYYELGSGPTLEQELAKEFQAEELLRLSKPKEESASHEDLLAAAKDATATGAGKGVYGQRCASCHGDAGQGLIGPNLTDKFWLHGGKIVDVYNVVSKGVLEKGMPAWEPLLKPDEMKNVVAYIWSLRGTNPPNAKAPQGPEVNDD